MRYAYTFLGAAAMVAAAPASSPSQAMDFNAILTAAAPSLTGAPSNAAITEQTDVYNQDAATSSAAAAVTGVASAVATASVVARDLDDKDELEKRRFCIFGICFGVATKTSTTAAATATATGATQTTAAATTTGGAGAQVTTAAASAATGLYNIVVPSSCTPVSWTNTFAFITTDTACPEPYEVGTYCGFINPEDPCAAQPAGWGPKVVPDTAANFLSYPAFQQAAASAPVPKGYANTFKNYNASVSANSYLGMHTLRSYDVAGCASFCDSTDLCTGFNIYVERDPGWNPDQCSCKIPDSITNYQCTLWGSGVEPASATNQGGWRLDFNVVITASNGYEKTNNTTPVTPPGWTNPQNCSGNAHSHPSSCIGQKFFPGPFDVSVCSAYANAQNKVNYSFLQALWNRLTGYNPTKCNFFNAYMVKQDGVAKGTYCSLFAQQFQPKEATYQPGWNAKKYFGVESSWSYCSK